MKPFIALLFITIFSIWVNACCSNGHHSVESMKTNFEENEVVFNELASLFSASIPDSLKHGYMITFTSDRKGDDWGVLIEENRVRNGKRRTIGSRSFKGKDESQYVLHKLGWQDATVYAIRHMLSVIGCTTIRTVDYKYFDIEIYDDSKGSAPYTYLHLKPHVQQEDAELKRINRTKISAHFCIL